MPMDHEMNEDQRAAAFQVMPKKLAAFLNAKTPADTPAGVLAIARTAVDDVASGQ
jgi:hypothetical protein